MTSVRRGREGAGSSLSAAGPVPAVPEARRERGLHGVQHALQRPLTRPVRSVADQLTRQVGLATLEVILPRPCGRIRWPRTPDVTAV